MLGCSCIWTCFCLPFVAALLSGQLQYVKIFHRLALFRSFKPKAYPAVPGLEGVGTVVKSGSGASKYKVGLGR